MLVISYLAANPDEDPHLKIAAEIIQPAVDKIGNAAAAGAGAHAAGKLTAATMANAPAPAKIAMLTAGAAGTLAAKLGMEHLADSVKKSSNNSSGPSGSSLANNTTAESQATPSSVSNTEPFANLTDISPLDYISNNNLFIFSPNEHEILTYLFSNKPAEIVLSSILILSIVILVFILILALMLFLLNNNNINFNFLKNYFSEKTIIKFNSKVKILANTLGKTYKFNIITCIFLIIIFDCFIIYMVYTILNNLDVFCSNYLDNLK